MEVLELLLSNILEAIPITKCNGLFSFNSYIPGFHAYKQNWDPVLGRRYLNIVFKIINDKGKVNLQG